MSKKVIQATLQRLLGFQNYLFIFSLYIISTIRWNRKEGDIKYLLDSLKPTDTVLDIGANIGIMTVLLARKCAKGKVIAFEPIPDNIKALSRLTRFLGLKNVDIHPIALGSSRSQLEMRMPVIKGVKMQGLSYVHHPAIEGYSSGYQKYMVAQHTLDEIVSAQPVHAIKMDVENYEYFVLQGALELINTHKPVIYMELWDNENRVRCMELLSELGYDANVLINGKLELFEREKHSHQNFFFINSK